MLVKVLYLKHFLELLQGV